MNIRVRTTRRTGVPSALLTGAVAAAVVRGVESKRAAEDTADPAKREARASKRRA